VLLKLGRVDKYRELCQAMLDQFDESSGRTIEGHAIQACLWHPDAVDDPQRLVARMQVILDGDSTYVDSHQTAMGIAQLRCGSPSDAIEWLEKPLGSDSSITPRTEIRILAPLAIAYHQTGKAAKAKEIYEQAMELYSEEAPESGMEDLGRSWHDWLICDLLLEEARKLLFAEPE
jgi:tetratricopeptide (TPR) repeat protein